MGVIISKKKMVPVKIEKVVVKNVWLLNECGNYMGGVKF